jgi:predicted dehydrogenase
MGLAHGRVLEGVHDVLIVSVCDANLSAAERLAESFAAHATDNLDEVLGDAGVEAVILTTPTSTHAEVACAAARAGKAIFLEKPIADSLPAADRVVKAVREAGVPCQVGFQRRYDPAYLEAKRKIEAGELGRLEGFRGVGRDPSPPSLAYLSTSGGLMVDMGIHDLDSARFFLGEVEEVYSIGGAHPELAAHGLFDTAVATLRFASGALGTLEVGLRTVYGYEIRAEILGEKGRLHLEMESRHHLRQYGKMGAHVDPPRNFAERFATAYAGEIRAFAENVHHGRPVSPGPEDARESLRLALAAQHSLETGEIVNVQGFGS